MQTLVAHCVWAAIKLYKRREGEKKMEKHFCTPHSRSKNIFFTADLIDKKRNKFVATAYGGASHSLYINIYKVAHFYIPPYYLHVHINIYI